MNYRAYSVLCRSSRKNAICRGAFSLQTATVRRSYHIGLFGIKEDRNGSHMAGPAKAPPVIRRLFDCDSSNTTSEIGISLGLIGETGGSIKDCGDIEPSDNTIAGMYESVAPMVEDIVLKQKLYPLVLGGDHSITYPVVKALKNCIAAPITIVHFDAHPDFYPLFQDSPSSHASPFARIMESDEPICKELISVGIRCMNEEQSACIKQHSNVTIVEARHCPAKGSDLKDIFHRHISENSPVYISVDIDVLDPAYAPGVSHRESGGLSVRQLVDAIHCIPGKVIGADLVEYNVDRDVDLLTASAAAKIMKELAAKIIDSNSPTPRVLPEFRIK
jgi:arginase